MAEAKDPMEVKAPAASQDVREKQGKAGWPQPGEEGFVHPDGTPQSVAQLEQNKQAAADRAAAGSIIHGAPTHAGNELTDDSAAKAVERAAEPGEEKLGAGYEEASDRNVDVNNPGA